MSNEVMNKENWVKLFRKIGLDDETMRTWHREFESDYPAGHQSFLEWLGIPEEGIRKVREL
jgi:hypothetical protein